VIPAWIEKKRWWLEDIGAPFLITRLVLLFIGWFSQAIPPTATMPTRGWQFSPHRLLDIWGRWDTGWYISIIQDGYGAVVNQYGQSSTAFFPAYPYLVKLIHHLLVPPGLRTTGTILFVGLLVSNAAFLGALTLLHSLIRSRWSDRATARTAALFLCVFPTSFVLSAFYTEALYLFLSVAAFYCAEKGRWGWAGAAGGLLAVTRAQGVLIVIPLAISYWQKRRRPGWSALYWR